MKILKYILEIIKTTSYKTTSHAVIRLLFVCPNENSSPTLHYTTLDKPKQTPHKDTPSLKAALPVCCSEWPFPQAANDEIQLMSEQEVLLSAPL